MLKPGSHWLVAGASKRLGLLLARKLLEQGAKVSALYRTLTPELEELCRKHPSQCALFSFDLCETDAYPDLIKKITDRNGSLSGLLLVASEFYKTPWGKVTEKDWDTLFSTNVKGHTFLAQACTASLEPQSQIIALADIFGSKPLKAYMAYAAAKAALLSVVRNLAKELAPHVRVNAISPGPVLLPESFSPQEGAQHAERTLLGKLGTPEDIWEAVQFLIEGSYLTGVNLKVDGGASLV